MMRGVFVVAVMLVAAVFMAEQVYDIVNSDMPDLRKVGDVLFLAVILIAARDERLSGDLDLKLEIRRLERRIEKIERATDTEGE